MITKWYDPRTSVTDLLKTSVTLLIGKYAMEEDRTDDRKRTICTIIYARNFMGSALGSESVSIGLTFCLLLYLLISCLEFSDQHSVAFCRNETLIQSGCFCASAVLSFYFIQLQAHASNRTFVKASAVLRVTNSSIR